MPYIKASKQKKAETFIHINCVQVLVIEVVQWHVPRSQFILNNVGV